MSTTLIGMQHSPFQLVNLWYVRRPHTPSPLTDKRAATWSVHRQGAVKGGVAGWFPGWFAPGQTEAAVLSDLD